MTCRVNDNLLSLEGSAFQDLAPELFPVLHWLFRLQQNQTTYLTLFLAFESLPMSLQHLSFLPGELLVIHYHNTKY